MTRIEKIGYTVSTGLMVVVAIALAVIALGAASGCNQTTSTPINQLPDQQQTTPNTQQNDQATQGSDVLVMVLNAPNDRALDAVGSSTSIGDAIAKVRAAAADGEIEVPDNADGVVSNQAGNAVGRAQATFVQAGITVNVTTGGTTPTATGTASNAPSMAQPTTATATAYPTQDVRPELTTSVPLGFAMPGGMVDLQSSATGRGTTSGVSKESANQLTWTQLKTTADMLRQLPPEILRLLGLQPIVDAATQPAWVEDGSGN